MTEFLDRLSGQANRAIRDSLGRQITYGRGAVSIAVKAPFFAGGATILQTGDGPGVMTREPEARIAPADLGALGNPTAGDTITVPTGEVTGVFRVVEIIPDGSGLFRCILQRQGV